jgi:hypothetical protein
MVYQGWFIFLQKFSEEAIIAISVAFLISMRKYIVDFLKKINARHREKNVSVDWDRVAEIDGLLERLGDEVGARYVHLVRYHNGLGHPKPPYMPKMSLTWEQRGRLNGMRVQSTMNQWKDIYLTEEKRKIAIKTFNEKGEIFTVRYSDVSKEKQEMLDRDNIKYYKQMYVKTKTDGWYALRVSFGDEIQNVSEHAIHPAMIICVNQLRHIL